MAKILALGFTPNSPELKGVEGITFLSEEVGKYDPSAFDRVVYRHPNIDGVEGPDENLAELIQTLPSDVNLIIYCNNPCADFGIITGRGFNTGIANMPATLRQALK